MHRAGGGTSSSSAAPRVGASRFPSGSAPCSCFGRPGVAAIRIWAGDCPVGSVLALGDWSPTAQAFASRVDRVRRAFGEDLCVDLGSASESADESESLLSWARLTRLPGERRPGCVATRVCGDPGLSRPGCVAVQAWPGGMVRMVSPTSATSELERRLGQLDTWRHASDWDRPLLRRRRA